MTLFSTASPFKRRNPNHRCRLLVRAGLRDFPPISLQSGRLCGFLYFVEAIRCDAFYSSCPVHCVISAAAVSSYSIRRCADPSHGRLRIAIEKTASSSNGVIANLEAEAAEGKGEEPVEMEEEEDADVELEDAEESDEVRPIRRSDVPMEPYIHLRMTLKSYWNLLPARSISGEHPAPRP